MRRKVPNLIKSKSVINSGNIRNDKASDLMKHYGLTEHGLQQQINAHIGSDASQDVKLKVYQEAYGKKNA